MVEMEIIILSFFLAKGDGRNGKNYIVIFLSLEIMGKVNPSDFLDMFHFGNDI